MTTEQAKSRLEFGISDKSMRMMQEELSKYTAIEQAAIFGSRAIGNYKNGSDIDLVIYCKPGKENIADKLSIRLNEELPLPYYFDVVQYERLKNQSFIEHIDQHAKLFYSINQPSEGIEEEAK
jgi:predicted nucleotidyltransferase